MARRRRDVVGIKSGEEGERIHDPAGYREVRLEVVDVTLGRRHVAPTLPQA